MGHFVRCILKGLRQGCAKTFNYDKLANIEQEDKEALGKIQDKLNEDLYTEFDPESEEGRVILKDRFLTHLGLDMHHKLLKQVWIKSFFS